LFEHDVSEKPDPLFPDHALACRLAHDLNSVVAIMPQAIRSGKLQQNATG
jgi:hypothetical protein